MKGWQYLHLGQALSSKLVKLRSAASARLPDFVEPMQAKLVDSMRPEDRIYEIKFDRCRALALLGGSETWILSPNQKDRAANSQYPSGDPFGQESRRQRWIASRTPPPDHHHCEIGISYCLEVHVFLCVFWESLQVLFRSNSFSPQRGSSLA